MSGQLRIAGGRHTQRYSRHVRRHMNGIHFRIHAVRGSWMALAQDLRQLKHCTRLLVPAPVSNVRSFVLSRQPRYHDIYG